MTLGGYAKAMIEFPGKPHIRNVTLAALAVSLAACSSGPTIKKSGKGKYDPKYGVSASARVATKKGEFRKGGGHYKVGKPYRVAGKLYRPKDEPGYNKTGKASWYGDDFHGRLTANGEIFDMNTLTAAHPTLPLPSYARVTNLKNGRSVIVRINDRGPYAHGRVIDLSKRVAQVLAFQRDGITDVRVKYIGRARMDGEDARYLEASFRKRGQAIGNDFKAVPKEGQEHRVAPTVMMASAQQPAPAKAKKSSTYILAHLPGVQPAVNGGVVAPSPAQLAAPARQGWAPIDLVGDGYRPPVAALSQPGQAPLGRIAPIQLNYAQKASLRVAAGHKAIADLAGQNKSDMLRAALVRKMREGLSVTSIRAATGDLGVIGSFEASYARRVGIEFARLAAVDLTRRQDGQVTVAIGVLKSGVSQHDVQNLRKRLGL